MASKTKISDAQRLHKTRKGGKDRKKALERKGTTPVFPVHTAPAKAK